MREQLIPMKQTDVLINALRRQITSCPRPRLLNPFDMLKTNKNMEEEEEEEKNGRKSQTTRDKEKHVQLPLINFSK